MSALADPTWENFWEGQFFGIGADHYKRAWILVENEGEMDARSYWKAVASVWQDSERQPLKPAEWARLFSADRPQREELMTTEERSELASLPERVTVYRGVNARNALSGLSWTLDRDIADWFAQHGENPMPVVMTGCVLRRRIVALFQERRESEIVVFPRHVYDRRRERIGEDRVRAAQDLAQRRREEAIAALRGGHR